MTPQQNETHATGAAPSHDSWIPDEELVWLRKWFLRRAASVRKFERAMFKPLLNVATDYGKEARDRRRRLG